jgi:hypothetical protein
VPATDTPAERASIVRSATRELEHGSRAFELLDASSTWSSAVGPGVDPRSVVSTSAPLSVAVDFLPAGAGRIAYDALAYDTLAYDNVVSSGTALVEGGAFDYESARESTYAGLGIETCADSSERSSS